MSGAADPTTDAVALLAAARALRPALLKAIYSTPRYANSLEEDERYFHLDLARLSRAQLLREQARLRRRLELDDRPEAWFLQRAERLAEALRAR